MLSRAVECCPTSVEVSFVIVLFIPVFSLFANNYALYIATIIETSVIRHTINTLAARDYSTFLLTFLIDLLSL